MIAIPTNPNSVYIPTVQTGCMKAEFDSTYPIHLSGIISREEFQESINKINLTIASNKLIIAVALAFGLCIVSGMICFIVGGITAANSDTFGFPVLVSVGIGMTSLGSLVFGVGCCIAQSQRSTRMRQAISEESTKYSSRSPTPCSWRLNVSRGLIATGYRYQHHAQLIYHIVIDIGRTGVLENGNVLFYSNLAPCGPTVLFEQQENCAPPPYSVRSTGFCSHCGVARQELTAKFCSSCGQLFNRC